MPTIKFKAKVESLLNGRQYVKVPKLTKQHCDMHSFRIHKDYSWISNSDLFQGLLNKVKENITVGHSSYLYLDSLPPNVSVNPSGFLAETTICLD